MCRLVLNYRERFLAFAGGPHVVDDVGANHGELDDKGEQVDGALLDCVTQDVDLVE